MPSIYHYDADTGAYLGSSDALPSPMEPGVYLTPAHATTVAPPQAGPHETPVFAAGAWSLVADYRGQMFWLPDGTTAPPLALGHSPDPAWTAIMPPTPGPAQAPVFADGAWSLQPDYRGQRFWKPDGTPVMIEAVGESPDPTWTNITPPAVGANMSVSFADGKWTAQADYRGQTYYQPNGSLVTITMLGEVPDPTWTTTAPTLAQVQAHQLAVLTAACDAAITAGFATSALGSAHSYGSLMTDQANLSAAVSASLTTGLPADWCTSLWCADGAGVWAFAPHTAAQVQAVNAGWITYRSALQSRLAALKAQVAAAASADAVRAVVWG